MRFKYKIGLALLVGGVLPLLAVAKIDIDRLTTYAKDSTLEKAAATEELKIQMVSDYINWLKDITLLQANAPATAKAINGFVTASKSFSIYDKPNMDAIEDRFNYQADNTPSMQGQTFEDWSKGMRTNSLLLQSLYIADNPHPIGEKHLLDRAEDTSGYSQQHASIHPSLRSYLEQFGLYDVFLIEPRRGTIIYSVYKEMDFGTSLLKGPYANSIFADGVREIIESKGQTGFVFKDFAPYAPSYDAQAAFMMAPVMQKGKLQGIFAIQLPLDFADGLLSTASGGYETADTYLVGSDGRLRSTPQLGDGLSVGDPVDLGEMSETPHGSFEGANYLNRTVIASWGKVTIPALNLDWTLVSEVGRDEAMATADATREQATRIALGAVLGVILLGLVISKWLVAPVRRLGEELQQQTSGPVASLRETGEQARAASETMAAAADETNRQTEELQTGTRQTNTDVSDVAVEVEQMSSSLQEVVSGVNKTSDLVKNASQRTQNASELLTELEEAAERITGFVTLIQDIAKQTNLLSLNASIEASRAGDAGRGFSVVANEIKKLADRTADSTAEISEEVKTVLDTVGRNAAAVRSVSELITEMNAEAEAISGTAAQQGVVTSRISDRMSNTAQRVSASDKGLTQVRSASDEVARAANDVLGGVQNVEHAAIEMQNALSTFANRVRVL